MKGSTLNVSLDRMDGCLPLPHSFLQRKSYNNAGGEIKSIVKEDREENKKKEKIFEPALPL